jgi:hypothetical protein
MSVARVIGVDPGLVHTGLVGLEFDTDQHELEVSHALVQGIDVPQIQGWCMTGWWVFVEAYRPRLKLQSDMRMVQAEQDLRRALPTAKFIPNMGILNVVSTDLLKMLEVWKFPTTSHHQDLRSAARIALLGMMKDKHLNTVLSDTVRDALDGDPWIIKHK